MNNDTPVNENSHVQELMKILRDNGLDTEAQGVSEVVGQFAAMENEITKTIKEVSNMRLELSTLRDEQNHPIKTMLEKAADKLLSIIKAIQTKLTSIKEKITGGCERAVEAFKNHGIIALNSVVTNLDIKYDLQVSRDLINESIEYTKGRIAKIEAVSEEMHGAGRAIKNIGRAIQGKEPVPGIKPNGKLARLVEAPFRMDIKRMTKSLGRVNKMLDRLDNLEKAAEMRAEKNRPSTLDAIREKQPEMQAKKIDTPVKKKTAEAEI